MKERRKEASASDFRGGEEDDFGLNDDRILLSAISGGCHR